MVAKRVSKTELKTIPAMKGHPLLGNAIEFQEKRLDFLIKAREMGDIVMARFGPRRVYILNNPEFVYQLFVSDASKFTKTPMLRKNTAAVIGEGLLTSEGEFHKRQRRLAQPAFHAKRIASYAQVMTTYAEEHVDNWHTGQKLDITHEMVALTQRIVSKTLFDADISDSASKVGDALTTSMRFVSSRMAVPIKMPEWVPTKKNLMRRESVDTLNNVVMRIIEDRRRTNEDKGDLLSMLMLSEDEEGTGRMSDKQLHDEVMTLFLAGHETTSNSLAWTWYLLSQNPAVLAKMQTELDTVLAGRPATMMDLGKLPYNEMIVKEAMRLYPPAWIITRQSVDDVQFGKTIVPKGSIVIVSQWAMHRSPRYYQDPEKFIPERWTPEFEKDLPRFAYFPFGGGPRICIGNSFATMEARLILATIAQHYTMKLAPDANVEPEPLITLRPNGLTMIIESRETIPVATAH